MRREFSLGELLTLQRRPVQVEPEQEYAEIGVRSFGKGIFHKLPRLGLEVGDKELHLVKEGDFILQITFAWEGAIGLASGAEDGMYCSVRFPTFRVNEELCEPKYLLYYFKTPAGLRQLGNISPGSAGRNRVLSVKRVPEIIVALPRLDEQRSIVAHIEALAARIAEARGLRQLAVEEAEALVNSAMHRIWGHCISWNSMPLGDLVEAISGQVDPTIEPYTSLPHINGEVIESGTCRLLNGYRTAQEDNVTSGKYHFRPNAILYSKIRPYLRKAVQVPFEGVCSADIYAFEKISNELNPRFFMYTLVSPEFSSYANELSNRTRMPKLNQDQLYAFNMKYPSLDEQCHIVAYLDDLHTRIDALKRLQAETAAELDALLPAVLDRAFRGELL